MDLVDVLLLSMVPIGVAIGYVLRKLWGERKIKSAEQEAEEILEAARAAAEQEKTALLEEAKAEIYRVKRQADRELRKRKLELERWEKKIQTREANIDKKFDSLDARERLLLGKEKQIEINLKSVGNKEKQLEQLRQQAIEKCEAISGLTVEEAKKLLLENLEADVKQEAAAVIRRIENETREFANRKARQIITLAIQKCSSEQVTETTVSVVNLPNEEMKGRIIGREGRNIRAFEAATGCNIIVDDTPDGVVLSCFDPLRREIAKRALEKLIADGRIHPARIEEVVARSEKEINEALREVGEQAAFNLGIHELHPELIKLIGRLKYRTSYGQNVLSHSIEVAKLASTLASELGVDSHIARRAGLLHDLGKAVSYDMEGTHALIGAEIAKKFNESPAVVHAVAAHHGEEEFRTLAAVLVQAADAVSAARPGARRETLESYIKRLEKLEEVASSFEGVVKSYAIQAGREVRIIVEPNRLSDNECAKLAREVTKKIEKELEYPGQIKVLVVRETRAVDYAR